MKVLMLDLVEDLRAKRIWPVALILLFAIIAVPLVLLGAAGAPIAKAPAPAPPVVAEASSALPTEVKLTESPEGGSSKLSQFSSHNPFKPELPPEKDPTAAAAGSGATGASKASAGAPPPNPTESTASPKAPESASAAKQPKTPKAPKTPKSDGNSTPAATTPADQSSGKGSGGGNKGNGNGKNSGTQRTRLLSYKVDASYGPGGRAKKHTIEQNDVFPAKQKYFLFSGMSSDGKEGIFTILDSSLVAQRGGEGHCKQVGGLCKVLYLRDGQARRFKDSRGNAYVLRLGAVDVVEDVVKNLTGKLADTVDKLIDPLK
ncbi:MAG: hypothetical protein QOG62_683 [Thermoleophilaceae bacterium]|jgi:hypothetical protein|nr:hypothetical protein [Thermoleophilaceae bacterium]